MGLLDEAKQERRRKGPPCTVSALLGRLSADDAAEVVAALADPDVPSAGLWRAMRGRGWDTPTQQTLQRHRRGECSCG